MEDITPLTNLQQVWIIDLISIAINLDMRLFICYNLYIFIAVVKAFNL